MNLGKFKIVLGIVLRGLEAAILLLINNLIYSHLIRYGDSGIMKIIQLAKPYGNDVNAKKVEYCTNHSLRNFSNCLKLKRYDDKKMYNSQ